MGCAARGGEARRHSCKRETEGERGGQQMRRCTFGRAWRTPRGSLGGLLQARSRQMLRFPPSARAARSTSRMCDWRECARAPVSKHAYITSPVRSQGRDVRRQDRRAGAFETIDASRRSFAAWRTCQETKKQKKLAGVVRGRGCGGGGTCGCRAIWRRRRRRGPLRKPVMCDFARAANHHRLHPVTTREGIPASMTTRMEKKKTLLVSVFLT